MREPYLEHPGGLAGLDIHVHLPEGRAGAGAGHQADGAGARADLLGAAVKQEVPDRQLPALRHAVLINSWKKSLHSFIDGIKLVRGDGVRPGENPLNCDSADGS